MEQRKDRPTVEQLDREIRRRKRSLQTRRVLRSTLYSLLTVAAAAVAKRRNMSEAYISGFAPAKMTPAHPRDMHPSPCLPLEGKVPQCRNTGADEVSTLPPVP